MRRAVTAASGATRAHLLSQYLQVVAVAGVLLASSPTLNLAGKDEVFKGLKEASAAALASP